MTGQASLGGTLVVDAAGLTAAAGGQSYTILTAEEARRVGNLTACRPSAATRCYFVPTYVPGAVVMNIFEEGDMDRLNGVDANDIEFFAQALRDPIWYEDTYGGEPHGRPRLLHYADGVFDFSDIPAFALIRAAQHSERHGRDRACMANVPEPNTAALVVVGTTSRYCDTLK